MKTSSNMHPAAVLRGVSFFTACVAWLALPAATAQENADPQSEIYQAGMMQGDVRRDAGVIEAQLVELRNQMRLLMPDDLPAVDQAIKKLQTLSAGEMADAMKALDAASRSNEAAARISEAIKSQGTASNELNKLAVDLKMRETLLGMDTSLTGLVRRQVSSNLETNRLGTIQKMPSALRGNDGTRCQLLIEGQKTLSADLKLLGKRIDTLAQDITDDSKNGLVLAAEVAKSRDLSGLAGQAETLLASGPFDAASTAQVEVIKTLVAMAQAVATSQDPMERLHKFADRLQQAVSDQQTIVDAVMLIAEKQDLDRGFKQIQGNLVDEIATIQYELQPVNNPVAELLTPAGVASTKSIKNFRKMREENMDARVNTQDSLKYITAAHDALKLQIAKAEAAAPQTAAELAAMLDLLHKQIAAAAAQQAQAARQPAPPADLQAAKVARVNDFQQRALPVSPEAATALGEAANELATPTPEAQMAASKKLEKAADDILKQKEKAEAIADAQKEIEKAQELTEKAQENLEKGDTAAAAEDLNAAQQSADAAQEDAQAASPAAAENLQKAAAELGAAKQDAGQKKGEAAQSKADEAAAALAEAAQGLAQAAGQMPGMEKGMAQTAGKGLDSKGKGKDKGKDNAKDKGTGENGENGGSADNLLGMGDQGGPVEVLQGLSPKERDAVSQLQKEAPPREFVPEVQQYYKNIADGGGF